MNSNNNLDKKANEYINAIQKYLSDSRYKRLEYLVSFLIVTLQVITLFNFIFSSIYGYEKIFLYYSVQALIFAYIAADFINGLIHMYMDNNTDYISIVGPYVAAFHLHHAKYSYRIRPTLQVYFDESGTKFWLLLYLVFLLSIQLTTHINSPFHIGLVAFSIFSSIAELSHYWCHNATDKNRFILWLQKNHLLLSKEHHKAHHCGDNIQYAFLNGITDPLINLIAQRYYKGYKNHADQHTQIYFKRFNNLKES